MCSPPLSDIFCAMLYYESNDLYSLFLFHFSHCSEPLQMWSKERQLWQVPGCEPQVQMWLVRVQVVESKAFGSQQGTVQHRVEM